MSDNQNLTFRIGTTWSFDVEIYDQNRSSFTPTIAIWRMFSRTGTVIECQIGSGIRIEEVSGKTLARIDVPPAMQSNVAPSVYSHVLHTTQPDGVVIDQVSGDVLTLASN